LVVEDGLLRQLKLVAFDEHTSVSRLIGDLVRRFLRERQRQAPAQETPR
jgi:hypothetical protein